MVALGLFNHASAARLARSAALARESSASMQAPGDCHAARVESWLRNPCLTGTFRPREIVVPFVQQVLENGESWL
jgi:hypothetical protein